MKLRILLLVMLAFATALIAATIQKEYSVQRSRSVATTTLSRKAILCSPDWSQLKEWLEAEDIPPIPGAGLYRWNICTKNDSAQFYFNQGINMYYSFHIIESMASFTKAERFDPECAMLPWAQALAYGPNINDIGYTASADALTAINKALNLSKSCGEKEQKLIAAQAIRYSGDTTQKRAVLNQQYADKMLALYQQYPDDADIAALYADALMLQHPWDLWSNDGTPKPWTPAIRAVLERLLAKTPQHPGANHYYIHVMEPSPFAYKALPSADRLGKLTPGLSHTVHMPSHIYLRTGNYRKGVLVNESAIGSYQKSLPLFPAVAGADFLYLIHNLHMQTNNALLGGREAYSVKSAEDTRQSISADYLSAPGAMGNYIQYIHATPLLVNIRFGRWKELLQMPEPPSAQVYAKLLYHFGRGMALANQHDTKAASLELALLQKQLQEDVLKEPLSPFSAAIEGGKVAEGMLSGMIAQQNGLFEEAISHFKTAVQIEKNMVYNEPRDWLLSPKQYLGNAYFHAGRWAGAEAAYLADLANNNNNVWSLYGLYQAKRALKKSVEADAVLKRFKAAINGRDEKAVVGVFK